MIGTIARRAFAHVGCPTRCKQHRCKVCGLFGDRVQPVYWVHVAAALPQHGGASRPYWAMGCGCPKFDTARGCPDHRWEYYCPTHLPDLTRPALQQGLALEAA